MKKPLLALAALALSATAAPSFAADWWNATPSIAIGKSASVDVRSFGALGNGVHDDTAAIQAAINSLPSDGGTVTVPAGHYMINALKPIKMRSHTRLLMDSMATLEVIPNSASRYWVIKVWDVTDVRIVGGNLVGDRAKHIGTSGEWGYGINIQGSKNVMVKGVSLSNFWGDGIWIGATGWGSSASRSDYVTINGVVSSNNRRQGLSIGPAQHVYIVNSTFKDTNGTLPEAGIDIEPQDQGPANTIRLEKNTFSGNRGNGIELHSNISDVAIVGNTMTGNRGFGVLGITAPYITVSANTMTKNGLAAVGASGKSHNWSIVGNTLQYNSTRYISPTNTGGGLDRDLQIGTNTYGISVSGNIFSNSKYNNYTR
ncbi:right-handed parallel beta-helix repeat-containing protein [Fulvimonas yonginensis]|uniref:right-handed parallel beta-helix repeat-containing protein n=1 Tax=Fulvimonas yonginensis TaxID=1495200 RepID=UPI00301811A5